MLLQRHFFSVNDERYSIEMHTFAFSLLAERYGINGYDDAWHALEH